MEKRRVAVRTLVETVMLSGSLSAMASSARLLDGTFSDCTQKTVGAIRVLRTSLQRRPA